MCENVTYRICSDCGETKTLDKDNFYNYKKVKNNKTYYYYFNRCKRCYDKVSVEYNKKNPEKRKEWAKKYFKSEKGKATNRRNNKKYREKDLDKFNSKRREQVNKLSTSYIKDVLYKVYKYDGQIVARKNISQEEVEKYREYLKIFREYKQLLKQPL